MKMFHPWDWKQKKEWSWNVQYHLFPWAVSDTSLTSWWATTVHKATWKVTRKKTNKGDKNFSFALEIQRVAQEQSQGEGEEPAHSATGPQIISSKVSRHQNIWIVPNFPEMRKITP